MPWRFVLVSRFRSPNDPMLLIANRYGFVTDSVAAKIESVIGPLAAGYVIATWQSTESLAVTNLNGGVRALTLLMDAAVAKCNPLEDCERIPN